MNNFSAKNVFHLLRCWSRLGKQGGRQELSLDSNGCRFVSIVWLCHKLIKTVSILVSDILSIFYMIRFSSIG